MSKQVLVNLEDLQALLLGHEDTEQYLNLKISCEEAERGDSIHTSYTLDELKEYVFYMGKKCTDVQAREILQSLDGDMCDSESWGPTIQFAVCGVLG